MNVLLVSPQFEKTFWSWKDVLEFVGKLAAFIPLALLTVAAMFPEDWEKELVDLNVLGNKKLWAFWSFVLRLLGFKRTVADLISVKKLRRADIVVISGMAGQTDSITELVAHCLKFCKGEIWAGGALFETEEVCNGFPGVTRFCIGKGERAVKQMLADYKAGVPRKIYDASEFGFPSISESPIPLFGLAEHRHYSSGAFQTCWGCPHQCTYCLERHIDGCTWQQKAIKRVLEELNAFYRAGFRGAVQIFSSNFAGNIKQASALSDAIAIWQIEHGYPYEFTIEAAALIARYPKAMASMVKANIKKVFLGLETENEACLREARKWQNLEKNLGMTLREATRKIHQAGMLILTGIIACGFDSDDPDFADKTIDFVQNSCLIPMVDTLQAQPGTGLWKRLVALGRTPWESYSNTAFLPNFPTVLNPEILAAGFIKIVKEVWRPGKCYKRICGWLEQYGVANRPRKSITLNDLAAFMRANFWIGLLGGPKTSYYYWRSLLKTFFSKKRRAFPDVVALWIYRVHFERTTREEVRLAEFWLAQGARQAQAA